MAKDKQNPAAAVDGPNDAYRQFEAAHLEYLQDVQRICLDANESARGLQAEYERAMIGATDENAVRGIFSDFQQRAADKGDELNPASALAQAFEKFKAATVKALANANMDQLDAATLAALGQSLMIIAHHAGTIASSVPPPQGQMSAAAK